MSATLGELAKIANASLRGDSQFKITGLNTLKKAKSGDIAFLSNRHYIHYLDETNASAVILTEDDSRLCKTNALISDNPYLSYAKIANYLFPPKKYLPYIDKLASIGEDCELAKDIHIAAGAVIGNRVTIDVSCYIGSGVIISDDVSIGKNTRLLSGNTLCHHVKIGDNVILHPGAVIGSEGFGMAEDKGKWLTIPQLGSVVIGNNVEIGANTTIDRGAIDDTIIEDGVRIDNQVQIGHNVIIGEGTAIAGCVAIAGSAKIGKRCRIGGLSAISGHIEICDDVMVTGMSGVPNTINEPGVYSSGVPITNNRTWRRNMARLRNLDEIIRKILKKLD